MKVKLDDATPVGLIQVGTIPVDAKLVDAKLVDAKPVGANLPDGALPTPQGTRWYRGVWHAFAGHEWGTTWG